VGNSQVSEGAPSGLTQADGRSSESDVEFVNRPGRIAAVLGLVAFGLRVSFVLVPTTTGVGELIGPVIGLPAMVVGMIALAIPGSHRMATVGIVFGALASAIGVGIGA
jgi:hypothetical protein